MRFHSLLCLAALVLLTPPAQSAQSRRWPQFRGPNARGLADTPLPTSWDTNKNVIWRTELPGLGWSSPVVWDDRIFLTTTLNEQTTEEPRKGLYFGGERRAPPSGVHRWELICLDWTSGDTRWRREVHHGTPQNPVHIKNSYASETPVTDGEAIYAYFGNVGLFCFDMEGEPRWSKQWPPVRTRYGWGSAASPILHGDRVYLVNDNEDQSYLLALDKKTGQEIWRIERDEPSNWATPFVWQNPERSELITPGRNRVRSYDLDGRLLWELAGMSTIVIPTPFAAHGLLYVCSGYVGDRTRPVYAIRPGAQGDISLEPGKTTSRYIAWSDNTAAPYNPSPLVLGDYLYVLFDFGFLSCYEAKTGKLVYEKERFEPQGHAAFTASPWASTELLYALSEDGDTYVVEPGPAFKILRKNSLGTMCLATPALAEGDILIRTIKELYRIGEKPAAPPPP